MNPNLVLGLSLLGVAIGGMDTYWHIHSGDPLGVRFYIGLLDAALVPVGAYFIGLVQRAPWEKPK